MDSNLRCDEAVLASSPPIPPRGREFDRVLVSSETLDNLHSLADYFFNPRHNLLCKSLSFKTFMQRDKKKSLSLFVHCREEPDTQPDTNIYA